MPRDVGRLLRTVAHLRPAQVWHRARLRVKRAAWSRRPARIEARYAERAAVLGPFDFAHPGLTSLARLRVARRGDEESAVVARDALAGRFRFLSVTQEFGAQVDWYRADLDAGTRLWKTLLHEFPYAEDLGRAGERDRFFELARSWRVASPIARPGFALDCWNSRAVARRMLHWAVCGHHLALDVKDDPDAAWLGRELAVHALFLADNLEWDLRANHLWSDLCALTMADAWLGCAPHAAELLSRQVDEQVLADGCHEERVPLYHVAALQELVEVRAVLGAAAPDWLAPAIERMAGWLADLLPEGGRLPLLGDTWHGEVDALRTLADVAAAPPAPDPQVVAETGGIVALRAGEAHVVARGGAHAPDHQMGHAHADGLSFELSLGGAPVVTDTGTPTYDSGPQRERARSTAAHNTLQLDGQEQIECWGSFRVGRRGHGRVVGRGRSGAWDWACAVHDGWQRLPGRPLHHRLWALAPDALLVLDAVTGDGPRRVRSALHLHPDLDEGRVRIQALSGQVQQIQVPLHERFNETRQMTELFLEEEARSPWYGGWLVLFEAGPEPPEIGFRTEEGSVRVDCRHGQTRFGVHWRPGLPLPPGNVGFSPCPAAGPSAS